MHPLFSRIHRLIAYLSLWVLLGGIWALYLMKIYRDNQSLSDFAELLLFCLPATVLLGLFSGSAFFLVRLNPIAYAQDRVFQPNYWLTHFYRTHLYRWLVSSLVISALWTGACATWQSFLENFHIMPAPTLDESLLEFMAANLIYFIQLLAYECYFAIVRSLEAQQATLAAEVTAREAELMVLRHQINPHFLFNSLNSISSLVTQNAAAARAMAIELAQFFRTTLLLSGEQQILLEQELELCQLYLNIEKIRFGEKLQTGFDVDSELLSQKVPPLLLQPLVENAVKHGMSQLTETGILQIGIRRISANFWEIRVVNPIAPASHSTAGTGLGLKNLQARLEHFYHKHASIKCVNSHNIFSVAMTLPLNGEN